MASSAQNMIEHITCAVCLEVCCDPHALKCLHTFCLECIRQIQRQDYIPCPECRENTPLSDIKKDFKTSGFIDLYNQQLINDAEKKKKERRASRQKSLRVVKSAVADSESADIKGCEICKSSDRPIKSKCIDCNQVMCESCALTHRGLASCQNHCVLSLKDAKTQAVTNLKLTVEQLKKDKEDMETNTSRITDKIDNIRKAHEKQIEQVNEMTDDLIKELNANRRNMNHAIFVANNSLVEKLHKSKQAFISGGVEIQENIDFITELVTGEDTATLTESAIPVDSSVKYDVSRIKQNLYKVNLKCESPVHITKGVELNVGEHIKLVISKLEHTSEKPQVDRARQLPANFNNMSIEDDRRIPGNMGRFPKARSLEGLVERSTTNSYNSSVVMPNMQHTKTRHTEKSPRTALVIGSSHSRHTDSRTNQNSHTGYREFMDRRVHGPSHGSHSPDKKHEKSVKNKTPVSKQQSADISTTRQHYNQVVNFSYKWERSCELSFYPQRICKVKNDIWIAGWDGVYIFNKNCQGIKVVKLEEIQMIRGLIYTHTGDIILACGGQIGLIKIDKNGAFKGKLSEGTFTDICTYKKKLYALENEGGKIVIFEHSSTNGWTQVNELNNFKKFERISVNNDCMYLSSREYCQVMVFNLDGHFLYETGRKGSRKAGSLNHPLLCDANYSGEEKEEKFFVRVILITFCFNDCELLESWALLV